MAENTKTVLLVEGRDNPHAKVDRNSFGDQWNWVDAPEGWQPDQSLPADPDDLDAVVVFSRLYEERDTRKLCEAIHASRRFDGIPVLVAINIYQMPLANRVKHLDNGGFVFVPVQEESLLDRLDNGGSA